MGLADVVEQGRLHLSGGGCFAIQLRALTVDLHDLRAVQIRRQQRIGLAQRVGDEGTVDTPVPIGLPGQRLERIGRWLAGAGRGLRGIDFGLLIGVEHLHQQTALGTLCRQLAQQPQLQGVVVRVVVLFADQNPRRNGQAFDQFLRGQRATAGQFADDAEIGVIAPLRGNRRRGRRYRVGLAGSQQAECTQQQKAHRFSLNRQKPPRSMKEGDGISAR
ncbi:hypothetical protein D3C73_934350 [compost metagenome]